MRSRAPNTFKQDSVITRADPRFETLDSSYDREVVFCQCERCDKLAEGGKWITTRVWKEQHGGEGPLPPGRSGRVKMIAKKGTVAGVPVVTTDAGRQNFRENRAGALDEEDDSNDFGASANDFPSDNTEQDRNPRNRSSADFDSDSDSDFDSNAEYSDLSDSDSSRGGSSSSSSEEEDSGSDSDLESQAYEPRFGGLLGATAAREGWGVDEDSDEDSDEEEIEGRDEGGDIRMGETPSRNLPDDDRKLLFLYVINIRNRQSKNAFADFAAYRQLDNASTPSMKVLGTMAKKMSGIKITTLDCCPNQCVIFSEYAKFSILQQCPECQAARYRYDRRGRRHPAATVDIRHPETFASNLLANPETSSACQKVNQQFIDRARHPDSIIKDWYDGETAKYFLELVKDFGIHDLVFAIKADSADLTEKAQKNKKTHNYFITLECLSLPPHLRGLAKFTWTFTDIGPKKPKSLESIYHPLIQHAKKLFEGFKTWSHASQDWVRCRVFVIQIKADTLEQQTIAGLVGPSGRISCLWCDQPGYRQPPSKKYYTTGYAPTSDPDCADSDLVLPLNSNPARPPPKSVTWKTIESVDEACKVLESVTESKKEKDKTRLMTGVSRRSVFDSLPLYRQLFPFNLTFDDMHGVHINETPDFLLRLTGVRASKSGISITPSQVARIDRAQVASQPYVPTQVAEMLRSFSEKGSNYKANENRTFISISLPPCLLGLNVTPQVKLLVLVYCRITILLGRREIDKDAEGEGITPNLLHLPDDGIPRARLKTIATLVKAYGSIREGLHYGRDPDFLKACLPTSHRFSHLPIFLLTGGPANATSSWALEAKIGTSTRGIKGRRNQAKQLSNNHTKECIVLSLESRFDLAPVAPPPAPSNWKKVNNDKINATVTSPADIPAKLTEEERGLLDAFCHQEGVTLILGREIGRYGKGVLENEDRISSIFGDKGNMMFPSDQDATQWSKKNGKLGDSHSSRAVRLTDANHQDSWGEVDSFLAVELSSNGRAETQPRLLAFIREFPDVDIIECIYPSFIRSAPRKLKLVGMEEIRMVVGLHFTSVAEEKTLDRVAVVAKSSGVGTTWKGKIQWDYK